MIKFWRFLSVSIVVAVCLGLLLVPAAVGVSAGDPPAGEATYVLPAEVRVFPDEAFTVNVTIYNPHNIDLYSAHSCMQWSPGNLNATVINNSDWPKEIGGVIVNDIAEVGYGAGGEKHIIGPYIEGVHYLNSTNITHCQVHFVAGSSAGNVTVSFTPMGTYEETSIYDFYGDVCNWTPDDMQNMTVIITGLQDLTVDVTGNGTVEANGVTLTDYPNSTNWNLSEMVSLEAVPAAGWDFVNWTGNVSDPDDPSTTVTMDSSRSVTANFEEQSPELDVDPDSLSLTVAPDATDSTIYTVTNIGGGTLSWNSSNVTYDPNGNMTWLTQNITNGTLTASVSKTVLVTANATGLAVGTYNATINITGNSSVELPVTLNVGLPAISVSPTSLSFTTNEGEDPPDQALKVCNSGIGTLDWSLSDGGTGWLSENPVGGSLAEDECDAVTVSVDVAGMEAGDYSATITITGSDEVKVPVNLQIVSAMPEIPVGPAQLSASALDITPQQVQPGQDVTISVNVANTGGATGSYNAVLYINGVVEDSQSVSVAAGTSKNVIFTVSKSQAGVYDVSVAGQTGQFEVVGGGGWFGGGLGTGGIIAIVVVVIVLIVAVVFILRGTTKPE